MFKRHPVVCFFFAGLDFQKWFQCMFLTFTFNLCMLVLLFQKKMTLVGGFLLVFPPFPKDLVFSSSTVQAIPPASSSSTQQVHPTLGPTQYICCLEIVIVWRTFSPWPICQSNFIDVFNSINLVSLLLVDILLNTNTSKEQEGCLVFVFIIWFLIYAAQTGLE